MKHKSFYYSDKIMSIAVVGIIIFGTLMILSAEMGNMAGDTAYLTNILLKQCLFCATGLLMYFLLMKFSFINLRIQIFGICYFIILFLLLFTRFFGQTNGAYAWIYIGSISIQPSEFAKLFMIALGAKIFSTDHHEKNIDYFKIYCYAALLYFLVIFVYQNDLGSSVVLFVICYCLPIIAPYKELKKIQKYMIIIILIVIVVVVFALSPVVTNILMNFKDDYRIARFLAAADPFLYPYSSGYHIIMSLVFFATGGLFGLGYGESIHKYMNFPNPSNDFILPVIVEELGFVFGFLVILLLYTMILFPVVYYSIKAKYVASKIVLIGTFLYFVVHFILNVGGVSGFIPLTGVPLLLISSGGSSWISSLMALGLCQSEIIRNRICNENNSGQV